MDIDPLENYKKRFYTLRTEHKTFALFWLVVITLAAAKAVGTKDPNAMLIVFLGIFTLLGVAEITFIKIATIGVWLSAAPLILLVTIGSLEPFDLQALISGLAAIALGVFSVSYITADIRASRREGT